MALLEGRFTCPFGPKRNRRCRLAEVQLAALGRCEDCSGYEMPGSAGLGTSSLLQQVSTG